MGIVSEPIRNLLGGVSKRSAQQRRANETVEQINVLADYSRGLGGRPGSRFVALLDDNGDLNTSAALHVIERSPTERFTVTVVDGALRVFDSESGEEITVTALGSVMDYLDGADPQKNIRFTTVDDVTYICNRVIPVQKRDEKSPIQPKEALVFIRQADFSTTYTLIINGTSVDHITPAGTDPTLRQDLATNHIAEELEGNIVAEAALSDFDVTRFGSTLYIRKSDGSDFSISGKDDLADGGMVVVKGSVQSFDLLPAFCKDGVVIEVVGDSGTNKDNYFVKYDDQGKAKEAGVWKECVKPNVVLGFDPATMPHKLVFNGSSAEGQAHNAPAEPNIYDGGGEDTSSGWADTLEGSESGTLVDELLSVTNGAAPPDSKEWFSELPNLTAGANTVTCYIDTTPMSYHAEYRVDFYYNEGPGSTTWHLASSAGGWSDHQRTNVKRTLTVNSIAGASLKAVAQVRSDSPTSPANGTITLHGPDDSLFPGVSYIASPATVVAFNPQEKYPEGFNFVLTLAGVTAFTYTAVLDDTGTEVAAALCALIEANGTYDCEILEDGILSATRTDNTARPAVVYTTSFDSDIHLFDPDTLYVVDGLIDQTIRNESDGSTGTVTDNSEHVIYFAAGLSGGTDNTVANDDFYSTDAGTDSFVFQEIEWDDREVGDDVTNKFPSFTGRGISDVLLYKTRLGFLSGNRLIFTRSNSVTNFFRTSARDIFDSDRIDVQNASGNVGDFHSHYLWNEKLYISAHNAQLTTSGAITPQTLGLDVVGRFSTSDRFRPLVLGNSVVVAVAGTTGISVWQYFFDNNGRLFTGSDLTTEVREYITGTPMALVGSHDAGFIALLSDVSDTTLFVLSLKDGEQNRLVQAWGKWTFNSNYDINGIGMAGDVLYLTQVDGDETYLNKVSLAVQEDVGDLMEGLLLDQRSSELEVTTMGSVVTVFEDTFTGGAGALAAHVPDTGGTWTDADSAFALNGTGSLIQAGGDSGTHRAFASTDIPWNTMTDKEAWFETTIGSGSAGNWGIVFLASKTDLSQFWLRITPQNSGAGFDLFNGIQMNARDAAGGDLGSYSETLSYATETPFGTYRFGVTIIPGVSANTTTVQIWREPAGGGTRTQLALWDGDADTGIVNTCDSDHVRFGVIRQSSVASCNWTRMGVPQVGALIPGNFFAVPFILEGTEADYILTSEDGVVDTADWTIEDDHTISTVDDLSAEDVQIGLLYPQQVDLSTLYKRDQNGESITQGRLALGYLDVSYRQSRAFDVSVTPLERTAATTSLALAAVADGVLHVPVICRNILASISILSTGYLPWWITQLLWDGDLDGNRARGESK